MWSSGNRDRSAFARSIFLCFSPSLLPFIHRVKLRQDMEAIAECIEEVLKEWHVVLKASEEDDVIQETAHSAWMRRLGEHLCLVVSTAETEAVRCDAILSETRKRRRTMEGDEEVLDLLAGIARSVAARCKQLHTLPIHEATCVAMAANRGIMARKAATSLVQPPPVDATPPALRGSILSIRAFQGASRRRLSLAHRTNDPSLLPRVAAGTPTPVAIDVAALNVEAECMMLHNILCVDTKLEFLRSMEALRKSVEQIRSKQLVTPSVSQSCESGGVPWFHFSGMNDGVVSVLCRNALRVELVFDLTARQWKVMQLNFLLAGTKKMMSLLEADDDARELAVLTVADDSERLADLQLGKAPAALVQISRVFAEKGFSEGCLTCLAAVAGAWLELADKQVEGLTQHLSQLLLRKTGASLTVEREPNSGYIAVVMSNATKSSVSTKLFTDGYSVYHQRLIGTDLAKKRVLDAIDASTTIDRRVEVDMEQLLWRDWSVRVTTSN